MDWIYNIYMIAVFKPKTFGRKKLKIAVPVETYLKTLTLLFSWGPNIFFPTWHNDIMQQLSVAMFSSSNSSLKWYATAVVILEKWIASVLLLWSKILLLIFRVMPRNRGCNYKCFECFLRTLCRPSSCPTITLVRKLQTGKCHHSILSFLIYLIW